MTYLVISPLAVPPPQVTPQLVVSSSSRPQLLPVGCSEDIFLPLPLTQVVFVMSVLLPKKTKKLQNTEKAPTLCQILARVCFFQ